MAGGFLIAGGRAADLLGRRRMFVIGAIIFTLASAMSGLAQDPAMLVGARFGQGLGEALAAPAALSLVVLLFTDPKERAKAIGAWGGISGADATLGVVISGVIVQWISWRWIFLVNLPVAGIVVFIVPRMIRESRLSRERQIDFLGAVLVTGGLTLVVDGLLNASTHSWGSGDTLIPLLIGVALLVAFTVWQVASRTPLVPRRFFTNRTRVTANFAMLFSTAGFFAMFFSLTLYMQDVLHYSALKTGLAWGPFGLVLFAGIAADVKILPEVGVKAGFTVSYLLSATGLFLLGGITTHSSYPSALLPGMLVMAFGQAFSFVGLQTSGLHRLGPADAGLGSAVQTTSQQPGPGRPGHHRAAPRHRAGGTWRRRAGGGHRRLCPGAEARRRRHGRWRRPCHRRVREDRLHRPGPAGARRSEGLSRPGRRSCLSRRAGTNPHRLSAVDPGPGYRESSPCHSDRVAVLMTRTKRTRSAARSNLLLPLPAAL
jgi:MFS family permease